MGEQIAGRGLLDEAGLGQLSQSSTQVGGADAAGLTQCGQGERQGRQSEGLLNLVGWGQGCGLGGRWGRVPQLQGEVGAVGVQR